MSFERRDFLRLCAGAAGTALGGRLWAAPGDARFLLVFLRGGYDATNVLVPVGSRFYYEARPNIAMPKSVALPLDADWSLHPALQDSVYRLWQKGEAACVPFAGCANLSRSHFETRS